MIIHNIDYIQIESDHLSSMACCLAMILKYYNIPTTPGKISELLFESYTNQMYNSVSLTESTDINSLSLSCAQAVVNKQFPISCEIISTDIEKIPASYVKRKMPVIVNGSFPLKDDIASNNIVILGYVDQYFIANDPKGNANTWYRDRCGEKVLYKIEDVQKWLYIYNNKIQLLRFLENKGNNAK